MIKICDTELLHLNKVNKKVLFGLDIYKNTAKDQRFVNNYIKIAPDKQFKKNK